MAFMVQEWDLVVKVANLECFYIAKVADIVIGRWILSSKLDLGPKGWVLGLKLDLIKKSHGVHGPRVGLGRQSGSWA